MTEAFLRLPWEPFDKQCELMGITTNGLFERMGLANPEVRATELMAEMKQQPEYAGLSYHMLRQKARTAANSENPAIRKHYSMRRDHGLLLWDADRYACIIGLHPSMIWKEWYDIDPVQFIKQDYTPAGRAAWKELTTKRRRERDAAKKRKRRAERAAMKERGEKIPYKKKLPSERPAIVKAAQFLEEQLADGPKYRKEVMVEAEKVGLSDTSLRRATKLILGERFSSKYQPNHEALWSLAQ